jgi:hypothetical protein
VLQVAPMRVSTTMMHKLENFPAEIEGQDPACAPVARNVLCSTVTHDGRLSTVKKKRSVSRESEARH